MTQTHLKRRHLLASGLLLTAFSTWAAKQPMVEVWKDPNCGCCTDWITILQKSGFDVRVNDTGNTAARARLGIPEKLGSCHTARIEGYALEGHVPVREIQRLLREKPRAIGLTVPGMPIGSPGMDGDIYNGRKDPYDVLLIAHDGTSKIYQTYHK